MKLINPCEDCLIEVCCSVKCYPHKKYIEDSKAHELFKERLTGWIGYIIMSILTCLMLYSPIWYIDSCN